MALFAAYFSADRPDCVLVLGDRYEIFAAATAAAVMRIPLAHISGGDVTLGAADEFFATPSLKWHRCIYLPARNAARVIHMGEEPPARCLMWAALGTRISAMPLLDTRQLNESLGLTLHSLIC